MENISEKLIREQLVSALNEYVKTHPEFNLGCDKHKIEKIIDDSINFDANDGICVEKDLLYQLKKYYETLNSNLKTTKPYIDCYFKFLDGINVENKIGIRITNYKINTDNSITFLDGYFINYKTN